jgi:hypothetical protein
MDVQDTRNGTDVEIKELVAKITDEQKHLFYEGQHLSSKRRQKIPDLIVIDEPLLPEGRRPMPDAVKKHSYSLPKDVRLQILSLREKRGIKLTGRRK